MFTLICLVINLLCFGLIAGRSLADRELTNAAVFGMTVSLFGAVLCTTQIIGDIIK